MFVEEEAKLLEKKIRIAKRVTVENFGDSLLEKAFANIDLVLIVNL